MSFAYALTYFYDAALYCAALGCLGLLAGCDGRLFVAAALLTAGAWLCGRLTGRGRWWLRYLPLLIAVPAVIAPGNAPGRLATLPMAAYLALYVYNNRRAPDYDDAVDRFRHSLMVAGAALLLAGFFRAASWSRGLPWLFLYLTLSMALLRLLRHDAAVARSLRFRALNLAGVAAVCGAGFALSRPDILAALGALWRWVAENVLLRLLALILYLIQWGLYLLALGLSKLLPLSTDAASGAFDAPILPQAPPGMADAAQDIRALPPAVVFILKAAGIVLLVALAFLVLRALSRRIGRVDGPTGADTRESLEAEAPRSPAALLRRGPKDGVRRQYRRALLLLRKRGGRVAPTMNTLQIERENAGLCDADALRALRALYLPARYGERASSREDAARARAALERLRKP